eukprot:m.137402 g.137402  ORF g.137402 m.137402 type:complete len:342 (-) comp11666_c0_seq1:130-1155(-)
MNVGSERWAFTTTWYDSLASLTRPYSLFVYPETSEIEMIDNKNNRSFLRKTKTAIPMSSFFLGAEVNVLGRQLKVVEYADEHTKMALGSVQQSCCVVLTASCLSDIGQPLDFLISGGFQFVRCKLINISGKIASALMRSEGLENVGSGMALFVELRGQNALQEVNKQMTSYSPDAHSSTTAEGTSSILAAVFDDNILYAATQSDSSSLCVVLPHAVGSGNLGKIVHEIQGGGLDITGMRSAALNRACAQEFFEVYKGVMPEYQQMVHELESGVCVAIEVTGDDAHGRLRAICGPHDSELARHVRPATIRAQLGEDKVKNAVHCTDLPEDTALELEYFFSLL